MRSKILMLHHTKTVNLNIAENWCNKIIRINHVHQLKTNKIPGKKISLTFHL